MIFYINENGDAMQVTPSAVHQGSNNASEIVLIADIAQSASVRVVFTLPNGIKTNEYYLVPVYGSDNSDTPFGSGVGMWRTTLDRSITEFSGLATASFMLTPVDPVTGEPTEDVTTSACTFNISKGYSSIGSLPDPSAATYNALAGMIHALANQVLDLSAEIDASSAIKSISFDEETGELAFVVNSVKTEDNPEGEKTYSFSLSYLRDGYFKDIEFENDVLTITIYKTDAEGKPSDEQYSVDLSGLRDGVTKFQFNAETANLTLETPGQTYTVPLGTLRDGNLLSATLDNTSHLVLSVSNSNGTPRNIRVNLGPLVGGLESVVFNDETNELILTYKTESGLQTATVDMDMLLDDLNFENGEGEYSIVQKSNPDGTENLAMSPNSVALGDGSMAGRYAFYIRAIDTLNKFIYLSTTKEDNPIIAHERMDEYLLPFDFSEYLHFADKLINVGVPRIGDYFSIIAHNHYHNAGRIMGFYQNRVQYSGDLPFDSFETDDGEDGYTFFIPNAPTFGSKLLGNCAIAEGGTAHAYGTSSTATGFETKSVGDYSHTEGIRTKAYYAGHAEGHATVALGNHAHAEGNYSEADGNVSHAEGDFSKAKGNISHAEGGATTAAGEYSHSQNYKTYAASRSSHAEGERSFAGVNVESVSPDSITFSYYHTTVDGVDGIGIMLIVNGTYISPYYVLPFRFDSGPVGSRVTYGIGGLYQPDESIGKTYLGFFIEGLSELENPTPHTLGVPIYYVNTPEPTEKMATHAEGLTTVAGDKYAHAEGGETMALGQRSHAEGSRTKAAGTGSHTEGVHTYTGPDAPFSHAEGGETRALAQRAHAEGSNTEASGGSAHAEGSGTIASAESSHAEGNTAEATAPYAHAEGWKTKATARAAHSEGGPVLQQDGTVKKVTTASGACAHAEGEGSTASGQSSHAEGGETTASAGRSHAEGTGTTAGGWASHAEGNGTTAGGTASHAEGVSTKATAAQDHAEGANTTASGGQSHAEGSKTNALGWASHSQGLETTAEGWASHAEGRGSTTAPSTNWNTGGAAAHAEGYLSKALHPISHVEGEGTKTSRRAQHVEGQYNLDDPTALHITGCGTSDTSRDNCMSYGVLANGQKYIKLGNFMITETEFSEMPKNGYTKAEINSMLGSYINDIDALIGGE